MNVGNISITALIVVVVVGALKDIYPKLSGNTTRLVALIVGGAIGWLAGAGILPVIGLDWISGAVAGVAAVGGVTIAEKAGGE